MELKTHVDLVRRGLDRAHVDGVRWDRRLAIDLVPVQVVIRGNRAQDLYGQHRPEKHVDCSFFEQSRRRLAALWQLIEDRDADLAGGVRRAPVRQALRAFGAVLHTVQDFPAHSNWVELHLAAGGPVPAWDWQDPAVPGALVSGKWWVAPNCGDGQWPEGRRRDRPTHGDLNKDHDGSATGAQRWRDGRTLHAIAVEVALAHTITETQRLAARAPRLVEGLRGPMAAAPEPAVDPGVAMVALREAVRRDDPRAAAAQLCALEAAGGEALAGAALLAAGGDLGSWAALLVYPTRARTRATAAGVPRST
jgi:hypothetical protein